MTKAIVAAKQVLEIEGKAVLNLEKQINDTFVKVIEEILACKGRVAICGMGKSGIIGRKIMATLASTGTPSFFIHPAEASHGDLGMVKKSDLFLAISNSGETEEIIRLLPFIQNNKNKLVAITNNESSSLAKQADYHLFIDVAHEACPNNLAPTTSTTACLALGDAIAVALIKLRNFKPENFARFHPAGLLGKKLILKIEDIIDKPVFYTDINQTPLQLLTDMSAGGKGLIPVMQNQQLVGVFTDGDLRRALQKYSSNLFEQKIEDIIIKNPKTLKKGTLAIDALHIMEDYNITAVPVLDGDKLIGVVNIHDILKSGLK